MPGIAWPMRGKLKKTTPQAAITRSTSRVLNPGAALVLRGPIGRSEAADGVMEISGRQDRWRLRGLEEIIVRPLLDSRGRAAQQRVDQAGELLAVFFGVAVEQRGPVEAVS